MSANLGGLLLLLDALEREGRTPTVVARSEYNRCRATSAWPEASTYDYVVVEDATWHEWITEQRGSLETGTGTVRNMSTEDPTVPQQPEPTEPEQPVEPNPDIEPDQPDTRQPEQPA